MKVIHRCDSEERQHFLLNRQYSFKLRPTLLYSGILSKNKDWSDTAHSHGFVEIMFVMDGKGTVYCDEKKYDFIKGDIIIYNAGSIHREVSCADDPAELLFIALDKVEITNLPHNHILPDEYDIVYPSGDMEDTFKACFSNIVEETACRDIYYVEVAQSYSLTLVMYIYRLISRLKNVSDIFSKNIVFETAAAYIDHHYTENLTLEQIAAECHISKYYLSHTFSDINGQPLSRYILKKRLARAKQFIKTTDYSIRDIALMSGFNNAGYFSRAFKRTFGLTPQTYRKSCTAVNNHSDF